jgi:Domain of unknown function DUF1828
MDLDTVIKDFRGKVCEQLRLSPEGENRFRVFTPFLFEDGDHLAIVLKREQDHWLLSDEGHTYMHLTYDLDEKDLRTGTRQRIITNALSAFSVTDRDGELLTPIREGQYGDALYSFVQALLKISDVSFLSRERVKSTFLEDFREFIEQTVPKERRKFDWHEPEHDPDGLYSVDCRIEVPADTPIFVYALQSDDKVKDATIGLHQYERWGVPHRGIGVFENQEDINRKSLARFSDVCDKQFSNLATNKERLAKYLSVAGVIQ